MSYLKTRQANSGWLIEFGYYSHSSALPRYLRFEDTPEADHGWTHDASDAIRFDSKNDAERFAQNHVPCECRAVKH